MTAHPLICDLFLPGQSYPGMLVATLRKAILFMCWVTGPRCAGDMAGADPHAGC